MTIHCSLPGRAAAFCLALLVAPAPAQLCGDCDLSGTITILDALAAAKDGAGLQPVLPQAFPYCDVDSSGAVTVIDALRIAQLAAGLAVVLVCDTPPVATLMAPSPPVFGDVPLSFTLLDAEGSQASVRLELSTDGGSTYVLATAAAGTQTVGLTAPPPPSLPALHTYTWDTVADLGGGVVDDMYIQLIPTDSRTQIDGAPSVAGPFDVSNLDVGTWSRLFPTGAGPSPRYGAASFTHSPNSFRVHLGGRGATRLVDSRALYVGVSPGDWSDPTQGNDVQDGRVFVSGVFDPVFQRTVLFGGLDARGVAVDGLLVLAGSPPTWNEPGSLGAVPGARAGASAVYDPARQRMLLIGGHNGLTTYGDTRALDLTGAGVGVWSVVAGGGLPAVAHASAVLDASADQVLLYGGRGAGPVFDDRVRVLDLLSGLWSVMTTAGTPPRARAGAGLLLDVAAQRLIVAGGGDDAAAFDDVHALDLSTTPPRWRPMGIIGGSTPGGRAHAAWFLASSGDVYVSGGTDPVTGVSGEVWRLDR